MEKINMTGQIRCLSGPDLGEARA